MLRERLRVAIVAAGILTLSTSGLSVVSAQSPSPSDCDAYARNIARKNSGFVGGAIKGGAGGALFGAIISGKKDRGRSAKRGAALGALIGGLSSAKKKEDAHRRAYDRCMTGQVRW